MSKRLKALKPSTGAQHLCKTFCQRSRSRLWFSEVQALRIRCSQLSCACVRSVGPFFWGKAKTTPSVLILVLQSTAFFPSFAKFIPSSLKTHSTEVAALFALRFRDSSVKSSKKLVQRQAEPFDANEPANRGLFCRLHTVCRHSSSHRSSPTSSMEFSVRQLRHQACMMQARLWHSQPFVHTTCVEPSNRAVICLTLSPYLNPNRFASRCEVGSHSSSVQVHLFSNSSCVCPDFFRQLRIYRVCHLATNVVVYSSGYL